MRKPEQGIYEACVKALNVRPKECLYVGDGGSELEAARTFGNGGAGLLVFKQPGRQRGKMSLDRHRSRWKYWTLLTQGDDRNDNQESNSGRYAGNQQNAASGFDGASQRKTGFV